MCLIKCNSSGAKCTSPAPNFSPFLSATFFIIIFSPNCCCVWGVERGYEHTCGTTTKANLSSYFRHCRSKYSPIVEVMRGISVVPVTCAGDAMFVGQRIGRECKVDCEQNGLKHKLLHTWPATTAKALQEKMPPQKL